MRYVSLAIVFVNTWLKLAAKIRFFLQLKICRKKLVPLQARNGAVRMKIISQPIKHSKLNNSKAIGVVMFKTFIPQINLSK